MRACKFYGLPPSPALLETRAVRELLHELGHLRGLAALSRLGLRDEPLALGRAGGQEDEGFCQECRERM